MRKQHLISPHGKRKRWCPEYTSTHMTSSYLAMRAVPVVIVVRTAIVDHGRNVWVVMLQERRRRRRREREREREREKERHRERRRKCCLVYSWCSLMTSVTSITACSPWWLLYVSKKIPNPVKKSWLPNTTPTEKEAREASCQQKGRWKGGRNAAKMLHTTSFVQTEWIQWRTIVAFTATLLFPNFPINQPMQNCLRLHRNLALSNMWKTHLCPPWLK